MLTITTANVNGVRAAVRRGLPAWLEDARPDVLCLQEVRAPDAVLADLLPGWHRVHQECSAKGRAGVAVLTRAEPAAVRVGLPGAPDEFADAGRWVEADLPLAGGGTLTVVSAYLHSGEAGTPKQDEKYRFMAAVRPRLDALAAAGGHALLTGDLNIAHREVDIKNWKGNLKKAGFLPEERAWLGEVLEGPAWVDVHRTLAGEGPGPYTWWSWRGQAFDNDAGWRIDYHVATPGLAALARSAEVGRATEYAARWSDHAPLTVRYEVAPA